MFHWARYINLSNSSMIVPRSIISMGIRCRFTRSPRICPSLLRIRVTFSSIRFILCSLGFPRHIKKWPMWEKVECWQWRIAVVAGLHCIDEAESEGATEDFGWSQFWHGDWLGFDVYLCRMLLLIISVVVVLVVLFNTYTFYSLFL